MKKKEAPKRALETDEKRVNMSFIFRFLFAFVHFSLWFLVSLICARCWADSAQLRLLWSTLRLVRVHTSELSAASHRRVIYDNVVHAIKQKTWESRRSTIAGSNFVLLWRSWKECWKSKEKFNFNLVDLFFRSTCLRSESLIA